MRKLLKIFAILLCAILLSSCEDSIEFYNNSVCNIIDVSAEGITRYGQFLINE
ncbi:MAG: hypothetical protein K5899_04150 [Bacteroidaceae bacterium]|nr:hypothetical protein [Bacteroidaceae bacterium]